MTLTFGAIASVLLLQVASVWSVPPISSPEFEAYPAFDPWTGDLWFVRARPDFTGWRMKMSRCGDSGWQEPFDVPIAGDGVEADPWFSPDGTTLWFISTRTTDGVKKTDLDIWRVTRDQRGKWREPERLPEPVNSSGQEWFPRVGKDGWLYFGSNRPGGFGKTDIWRARQRKSGEWIAENAGPSLNSPEDEYEPLPSPDGRRMLIGAADGYYESKRTPQGWGPRVRLRAEINVNGSETGATFSPSGKSWMFARDVGNGRSGEILLMRGEKGWPPACPKRKR